MIYLIIPKFGGFKDRKFFYAIFSPYENEDQYDLLISKNNTNENQYTMNCINENDALNESIKNNLIDLIDQNTFYSFKLNEDTIICKMNKKFNVSVVGRAGHIGLPLSVFLSSFGHDVTIIDTNQNVLEGLQKISFHFVKMA